MRQKRRQGGKGRGTEVWRTMVAALAGRGGGTSRIGGAEEEEHGRGGDASEEVQRGVET